tara:strand:+ start:581 stop:748 length:168 start_codon:yes stop_codon:yes gene_type:complete
MGVDLLTLCGALVALWGCSLVAYFVRDTCHAWTAYRAAQQEARIIAQRVYRVDLH